MPLGVHTGRRRQRRQRRRQRQQACAHACDRAHPCSRMDPLPPAATPQWNLTGLVEMIFEYLHLIRIYTKPKGGRGAAAAPQFRWPTHAARLPDGRPKSNATPGQAASAGPRCSSLRPPDGTCPACLHPPPCPQASCQTGTTPSCCGRRSQQWRCAAYCQGGQGRGRTGT